MQNIYIYTHTTEAFSSYIKLCLLGGLIITIPLIFVQIYMFIRAGVHQAEDRRIWRPLALLLTIGFLPAVDYWHTHIRPLIYRFFLSFANNDRSAPPGADTCGPLHGARSVGAPEGRVAGHSAGTEQPPYGPPEGGFGGREAGGLQFLPKFNEMVEFESSLLILNVLCILLPVIYISFELFFGASVPVGPEGAVGPAKMCPRPFLGPISKRYIKKRHFFLLGIYFVSSLVTPPDIVSTTLFAIPFVLFIEFAVLAQQAVRTIVALRLRGR